MITRWSLAVILLPLLWAVIYEIFKMGPLLGQEGVRAWWRYLAGAGVYFLLEWTLTKPLWLYVVGHELTHAISGLLSGAEVYSFKASSKGGEVRLSKSNAFIALSPYIIPIYAFVLILVYAGLRIFWPRPEATWGFQLLLGAALAFHFSLTLSAFHRHQTDLKVLGFFLSGVLIAIGNSLILGVLGVTLFTRTPTLKQFGQGIMGETTRLWAKGMKIMIEEIDKQIEKSIQKEFFTRVS